MHLNSKRQQQLRHFLNELTNGTISAQSMVVNLSLVDYLTLRAGRLIDSTLVSGIAK